MVRQDVRMKHMDEVSEHNFRLYGHPLVEWHLIHVAVNDPFIFPCLEISITVVDLF